MEILTDFGERIRVGTRYRMRYWEPHRTGVMFRDGIRRVRVWQQDFHNLVPAVGLEYLLRMGFLGQTLPTFNDGSLDAVRGRRYPDGRRAPRVWTTGTKAVGDICQPTSPGSGGRIFLCVVGGASGGSEPTWNTTPGDSTTDSAVTWREASVLYIGLKGAGTVASGDRMDSHAGWSEVTNYSETVRQVFSPAAATSGSTSNLASVASFSINATVTVAGAFMTDTITKGGTNGLLLGAGDALTAIDAINGSVIDVLATTTVSA